MNSVPAFNSPPGAVVNPPHGGNGGPGPGAKGTSNQLGRGFRQRRLQLLSELCAGLPRPFTVLDVGGTVDFWRDTLAALPCSLTVLNLFEQATMLGASVLVGDACDLSRFEAKSFDVVFSNSVLGHVGGWERQQQMAREIRRVGRRYFVQTPNQGFPVDWRTLVPFFHWLSPAAQAWCFRHFPVGRYRRAASSSEALNLATRVRNVSRAEVKALFPEAVIVSERVAGFTKSFILHHGF